MAAGSLETVKLVSDVAANAMTIIALLVGAIWAYWAFVRERTRWPKANLDLEISHRELTADEQLLHVKVYVQNTGRRRIAFGDLRVDVYRVLPLDSATIESVRQSLMLEEKTEAAWPGVASRIKHWDESERPEIEPGERDEYCFDFVVPATLEVAFIYVYLANAMRSDEKGWPTTVIYQLTESVPLDSPGNAPGVDLPRRPLRGRAAPPPPRPAEPGQQAPRPPFSPEQDRPRPSEAGEQG